MGKDEIFRKKRDQNFKRKSDFLFQRAEKILIVTEGIKTEPYYFAEIEKDYNR